jgi:N,N'-diacetyllegionaminate synthase
MSQFDVLKMNCFAQLQQAYLIAEIGVNHNGDMNMAREMVLAAKRAGADAVKFQTFTAAALVTHSTPKVRYQLDTTSPGESHYEMIDKLELGRPEHRELAAFCGQIGIDFLSTPYDIDSAKFLTTLGVKMFKTASADLVDLPLQQYIASTGKPAIVATGMANLGEVEQVVNIYEQAGNPSVVLLHCVSNYPCSDAALNLRAMTTLAHAFGLPVGYSDHSEGFVGAVISAALGAKVIEKHFTLDKSLPGPDHKASSSPDEFAELVQSVRRAERMLGSSRKVCQAEEQQMASVSRKSLVLARPMGAGETLTNGDLRLMRPGTGIPANLIGRIVGLRVRTDLDALHPLRWSDLDEP